MCYCTFLSLGLDNIQASLSRVKRLVGDWTGEYINWAMSVKTCKYAGLFYMRVVWVVSL